MQWFSDGQDDKAGEGICMLTEFMPQKAKEMKWKDHFNLKPFEIIETSKKMDKPVSD